VDDKAIDVDSLPPFEVQSTVGSGSVAERYPEGGAQPAVSAGDGPAAEAARPSPAPEPEAAKPPASEMPLVQVRVGSTIANAERDLIIATLAYCDGAKERTADMLGI